MACPLFSLFDQGNHVSKKGSIAVCYDAMSEKHLTETTFASFNLDEKIQKSLDEAGYTHCTPIQQKCIPIAIKGRDVAGQAQTGTGKTAAFMVATLQYLHDHPPPDKRKPNQPRVLVVAPTREHGDTIAVPDPHLKGGERHTETGSLHEHLGRVVGRTHLGKEHQLGGVVDVERLEHLGHVVTVDRAEVAEAQLFEQVAGNDHVLDHVDRVPEARVGDPVPIWGEGLPAEEIARCAGTLAYELFCGLTNRVRFRYVGQR